MSTDSRGVNPDISYLHVRQGWEDFADPKPKKKKKAKGAQAPSAFSRNPIKAPVTPTNASGNRRLFFRPTPGDKGMLKLAYGNLKSAAASLPALKRLARRFKKFVNNPLMRQYCVEIHKMASDISILSTDLQIGKKPPRVLAAARQKIAQSVLRLRKIMKRVEKYQARFASFGRLWVSVQRTAGNDPVLGKLVTAHQRRIKRLTTKLDGLVKQSPDKWDTAALDRALGDLAYRVSNFQLYLQHKATLLRWKKVLDHMRNDPTGGSVAYHKLINNQKYRKLKEVVAALERSAKTDEMDEAVPRSDGYEYALANEEVPVSIGAQMGTFIKENHKLLTEFVRDVSAARLKTSAYKRMKASQEKSARTVKEFDDIQKTLKLIRTLKKGGLKDTKKLKAALERLLKYLENINPKFLKGLPESEDTALIRQIWAQHEKRREAALRRQHPGKKLRRPKPLSPMGPPRKPAHVEVDRNRRAPMAPPRIRRVPTTVTLRPTTPEVKLALVQSALREEIRSLARVIASGDIKLWAGRKRMTALAIFSDQVYRNQFIQPIKQLADRASELGDDERRLQAANIAAVWAAKGGKEFMQKVQDASFYASNGAQLAAIAKMEKKQAELKKNSREQNKSVGFFVTLGVALHMGVAVIKGDKKAQGRIIQSYLAPDHTVDTVDTQIAYARKTLLWLRKMYPKVQQKKVTKEEARKFAHWSEIAPRILTRAHESLKRHRKGLEDFQWVATAGSLAILVAAAVASAYTGGATSGLLVNVGSGLLRSLLVIGAYSSSFATVQFLGEGVVFGKEFSLERFAKLQGKTFLTFLVAAPLMRGLNALLGIEAAQAGIAVAGQRLAVRLGQMYKLPQRYLDVLSGAVKGSKKAAWGQLILRLVGKGTAQLAGEIGIFTGADATAAAAMGEKHQMGSLAEMALTILLLRRLNRAMEPSARRATAGLLERAIAKHEVKLRRLAKSGKLNNDGVRIEMAEKGARLIQAYRIFGGEKAAKAYQSELSRYEKMYSEAQAREARANPAGALLRKFGLEVGDRKGEAALREAGLFEEAVSRLSPEDRAALKLNLRYYRPGDPALELSNGVRLRRINHILKKAGYEIDGGTIKPVEITLPIFNKPWSQLKPAEKAALGIFGGALLVFTLFNPAALAKVPVVLGHLSIVGGRIRSLEGLNWRQAYKQAWGYGVPMLENGKITIYRAPTVAERAPMARAEQQMFTTLIQALETKFTRKHKLIARAKMLRSIYHASDAATRAKIKKIVEDLTFSVQSAKSGRPVRKDARSRLNGAIANYGQRVGSVDVKLDVRIGDATPRVSLEGEYKHYTSKEAFEQILKSGRLKASAWSDDGRQPRVWVTDRSLSNAEVWDKIYQKGQVRGGVDNGKGEYVIIFRIKKGAKVKFDPGKNPIEFSTNQDLVIGRDIEIIYAGQNPRTPMMGEVAN